MRALRRAGEGYPYHGAVLYPAVPADAARLRLFVTHSHIDAGLENTVEVISASLRELRSS